MILSLTYLGPVNASILAALAVLLGVAVVLSLRRVHGGEPAPILLVAISLALPVLFATWASTVQHRAAWEAAISLPEVPQITTALAFALSRTLMTQISAGLLVVVGGLSLLIGSLILTVRGERPRWLTGAIAAVLAALLVSVAAAGMSSYPYAVTLLRIGSYALIAAAAVIALVVAHRRGPGAQLASLTAMTLPLVIVAADMATLAGLAILRFRQAAVAAPDAKRPILLQAEAALQDLQMAAIIGLSLAALLALIGPIVTWRQERPHAVAGAVALAIVLGIAVVGLTGSTAWLGPLRGE